MFSLTGDGSMKQCICTFMRLRYEQEWEGLVFLLRAFALVAAIFALFLGLPITVNDGIRTGLMVWGLFTGLVVVAMGVVFTPLFVYAPALGYMEREVPLKK